LRPAHSRRSPVRDPATRRLQPFRYLHNCSGCFRRERVRRVGLAPTGNAASGTAHVESVNAHSEQILAVKAPETDLTAISNSAPPADPGDCGPAIIPQPEEGDFHSPSTHIQYLRSTHQPPVHSVRRSQPRPRSQSSAKCRLRIR